MSFKIREIRVEDRPKWEPLWAGYLEFYNATLAPEITDATFARLLDPSSNLFALVAEREDGVLLGIVQCVLHDHGWSQKKFCYLEDLFVSADARSTGVGRALIEAVYARADANDWGRVYWLTHETNATARKLYDQVATNSGFIQYRRP
jgi:GNAT superfamily N-acetyltransferase